MIKLTFWGGARSVTGANYLLEVNRKKYLIECGLTQGSKFAEEQNYQPFPYKAQEIEAAFVTHAHLDHIGLLPKLVKSGFKGKIYATTPTKDLVGPMLEDAASILEEEAQRHHKKPLYQQADISKTLRALEGVDYGQKIKVSEEITVRFRDAGHVLGSAIIEAFIEDGTEKKKIVFSGDLGNVPAPFLREPEIIKEADYVLVESAYGDRVHEDKKLRKGLLEDTIEDTISSGGVLMIPAFALERTQELLYELNELVENHRIPSVPIFIDSPLAIKLTEVYKRFSKYYNKKAQTLIQGGDQIFHFPNLRFTNSATESKAINNVPAPKVIIAGSGMSNGGRILHHERRYLPDPKSCLLIIAWQPAGSLGRRVLEGAKIVRIFERPVQVRCRVRAIGGYSAHADRNGLASWIRGFDKSLKKVFVVQGEENAALSLANKIQDELGIEASVPFRGDKVTLR